MENKDVTIKEFINNQGISSSFQSNINNVMNNYNSLFNLDNSNIINNSNHNQNINFNNDINSNQNYSQNDTISLEANNHNYSITRSNNNKSEAISKNSKINFSMLNFNPNEDSSHKQVSNRNNYTDENNKSDDDDDEVKEEEEIEECIEDKNNSDYKNTSNYFNENENSIENNFQNINDENENNNINDTLSQITNNNREEVSLIDYHQNNINDHCSNSSFIENITLLNNYSNRNSGNITSSNNSHRINNNIVNRNEIIQNISNNLGNNDHLFNQNLNANNYIPLSKKVNNIKINNNNCEKDKENKDNESIISKQERVLSAPSIALNDFQKFIQSPQYINLEKAFLYANNLFLLKGENNFEIGTEEGNEICHKLLNQIEVLMISMNIKGENRDYRKKFTKAYYYLFEENKLCFLSEILDSAQENTPFIIVNDEQYNFSQTVLDFGNDLYNSFCSMIMLLLDIVKNIRDELFYVDINKIKEKIKLSLVDFDIKWVKYEEQYINELIEIEKKARKLILEGIKIENEIANYENKSKIKGKLLLNDNKYNDLRIKLINNILQLNKIANVNGKGRDDLPSEILFKAEKVLVTVSENQSKGMRNLALKIKNSLNAIRLLFHKYSKNIEGIDPQLKNNKDLSNYLLYFENKFELGKIYLLDKQKYSQLLFFSQIIEIICEKYSKYSIRELIENDDPSIFVSLPSILLLKAMNKEDQNICKEYIIGLNDKNNVSGKLFYEIKNLKKQVKKLINDSNKTYNILEKSILFDGTKEQLMIDKEIEEYTKCKEIISAIKKGLTNLSLHLQRYKPEQWNTFFQLAMDIKPLDKNDLFNDVNKTITTDNNIINEDNDNFENNITINESNNIDYELISNYSNIES